MSVLKIFSVADAQLLQTYESPDQIAAQLQQAGVLFERWQTNQPLAEDADQDTFG